MKMIHKMYMSDYKKVYRKEERKGILKGQYDRCQQQKLIGTIPDI